jgi:hypothetical protein
MLEQLNPMFRVLASGPAATAEQVMEVELHFGQIPSDYRALDVRFVSHSPDLVALDKPGGL